MNKALLRIVTTGSVDDGKSTLMGRLLYETKAIYEDQYEAIKKVSLKKGREADLSLLLDGLSAEREQAITIDVAYRYFSTKNRKFIIADCPGHEQYTKNMVTGASTANAAILLIDARKGLTPQSKRHLTLISLLNIKYVIIAINKMDLINYSEVTFNRIKSECSNFTKNLKSVFIPVSALKGDNIVKTSINMPWYFGTPLLGCMEGIPDKFSNLSSFRFSVQLITHTEGLRGLAGYVSSGSVKKGDEVVVLPSGLTTRIKKILTYDKELEEAQEGQSPLIFIDKDIDVSRGSMLVCRDNPPLIGNKFEAMICWMQDRPIKGLEGKYLLKHTTKETEVIIKVKHKINIDNLTEEIAEDLVLNDLGIVEIETFQKLFFDPYKENSYTGSFILIDPITNNTAAAGTILKATTGKSSNITWSRSDINRALRENQFGHKACVLWLTGLPSSGKSTLATYLEKMLFTKGKNVLNIDGDNLRHGLCNDLGFSDFDRDENIRRAGEVAKILFNAGTIVICSFVSPKKVHRDFVRGLIPKDSFFEIFIQCDLDTCIQRDTKGLYKRAINKEIKQFTGITSEYEIPPNPELTINTKESSVKSCAQSIFNLIYSKDYTINPGKNK